MFKLGVIISLFCFQHMVTTHASFFAFQTGQSRFSRKHFDNFTLDIINNTLYMDMVTTRTIHRGFKVLLDFQMRFEKGTSYQRLFAHILDPCAVVSSVRTNIFKSWFDSMLRHGNFMYNCPVPKGHYFLQGWKMDSTQVPHYMLPGNYCVSAHFFYGKLKTKQEDFVLDLNVYAALKA